MITEVIGILNALVIILGVMLLTNHLYEALLRMKTDTEKTRKFVHNIKQSYHPDAVLHYHTLRFKRSFLTKGDVVLLITGILLSIVDTKNGYVFITISVVILIVNRIENFHHHRMTLIRNDHIRKHNKQIIVLNSESTKESKPT